MGGQCPGNDRSAGKQRSGRTRKGSKWLNEALKEAAMAATRTNNTYLQALYRRQRSRIGHGKAIGAVKHSIICACWHMLTTGELDREAGGNYFAQRDPQRATAHSSPSSNASDTPSPWSTPLPDPTGFPFSRREGYLSGWRPHEPLRPRLAGAGRCGCHAGRPCAR